MKKITVLSLSLIFKKYKIHVVENYMKRG